jgi:putative transposase
VPRDWWLLDWEKQAIVDFHDQNPLEGYRRLTFMMLNANVVAASPSSVYRVLRDAGRLRRHNTTVSLKGTGFDQPLAPHQHWHIDIAYINVCGTFFFLCSLLDGFSRSIVHWEIRPNMGEADVETIIQRARERYPDVHPRIISDNGPQFIARDFKEFIRICGMTHVRTSPYYPQSNGKLERWHRTLKSECVRPGTPLSVDDAARLIEGYVRRYNEVRLHSAIGYVTPADKLAGRDKEIFAERDRRLEEARAARQARRAQERRAG